MKKILMAEYLEYNSEFKIGNHHYAKMFSQNGYEVLWLSPVYNQLLKIKNKDVYLQRKKLKERNFIELDKNIFGYSPYSMVLYGKIPLLNTKLANWLSIKTTVPSLNNVFSQNNFDEVDVLWLTNPKYYYLTKMIKYKKLVYRCADDITGFKEMCKSMKYFEEQIIKEADTVFVTAHSLMEKKRSIRNDLVYLPNGVELNNFIRDEYVKPREYKSDRKKCIYVGAIDHWFDLKLIKYCAERLKDIEFYFIGPVKIDMSNIENLKNVFILGKRDYKELSNYIYYSDVGLIPFEINSLTDSITPIKLYEYMSVGINVVSTNFKEMNYIKSLAYVAKSHDEFCEYIEQAIKNKEKKRDKNIQFAKENTWENRFETISRDI